MDQFWLTWKNSIPAIGLQTNPGAGGAVLGTSTGNATGTTAKTTDSTESSPEIFDHPEQMPEYPGGPEALKQFLQRNLQMTESKLETDAQVKVITRFVVGPDGSPGGGNYPGGRRCF